MSEVSEKAAILIQCPACGHSAYNHWRHKGGRFTDATHNLMMKWKNKEGEWYGRAYADNEGPVTEKGCFQMIKENFKEYPFNGNTSGYNWYEFCDCPIDQETVLALIRQGKTFEKGAST